MNNKFTNLVRLDAAPLVTLYGYSIGYIVIQIISIYLLLYYYYFYLFLILYPRTNITFYYSWTCIIIGYGLYDQLI